MLAGLQDSIKQESPGLEAACPARLPPFQAFGLLVAGESILSGASMLCHANGARTWCAFCPTHPSPSAHPAVGSDDADDGPSRAGRGQSLLNETNAPTNR